MGKVWLGLLLGSVGEGSGAGGKNPFGKGEALDEEAGGSAFHYG